MAPAATVLDHLSHASSQKWQAFTSATESWHKTLRLCLILFVAQVPMDIGSLLWLFLR
jgi:hypothetical protein